MSSAGSFGVAGVVRVRGPNHDAERNGSCSALLLWAIAGAWALVILAWTKGWGRALGHDHLIEHGPALWVALGLFLAGWEVMVVAMMLPSSLPAFRSFRASTFDLPRSRGLGGAFLVGYIAAWTVFGSLAFLGDIGVHRFVDRWGWLAARPWLIGGSILLVAGAFELSPLAARCSPRPAQASGAGGPDHGLVSSGAMSLGAGHGLRRLSRCWPLMLLSFAAGMASLWWMAALTLLMLLQERRDEGRVARLMGLAMLIAAGVVIAHPGWMPSLFPGAG